MSVDACDSPAGRVHPRTSPPGRGEAVRLKAALLIGVILAGSWLLPGALLAQDTEVWKGTVAFFLGRTCPAGWAQPDYAKGRLILATTNNAAVRIQNSQPPLADKEDRKHTHPYTTEFKIEHKSICAACRCCTSQGAHAGLYQANGFMNEASTGLPFIQYLVCEKQ
jgi:hypothetical protein